MPQGAMYTGTAPPHLFSLVAGTHADRVTFYCNYSHCSSQPSGFGLLEKMTEKASSQLSPMSQVGMLPGYLVLYLG